MDQVIHAAGISSLVASVFFVIFCVFRFVRARMAKVPWNATTFAEMTSNSPVTTGWKEVLEHGHRAVVDKRVGHVKTPASRPRPPALSPRTSQAKNLVFSDSEDTD